MFTLHTPTLHMQLRIVRAASRCDEYANVIRLDVSVSGAGNGTRKLQ